MRAAEQVVLAGSSYAWPCWDAAQWHCCQRRATEHGVISVRRLAMLEPEKEFVRERERDRQKELMTNVELWEEYVQSLVVCASHQLPQFSNFRDLAVIKSNRTVASLISAASVWGLIHFAILPTQSQFNAITSKYKRSYRSCYFLQGAGFNMLRCPAFIDTFTALRGCHAETWSGKQHCVLPGRAAWTTTSTSFDGQKNAREARRKEKRAGEQTSKPTPWSPSARQKGEKSAQGGHIILQRSKSSGLLPVNRQCTILSIFQQYR